MRFVAVGSLVLALAVLVLGACGEPEAPAGPLLDARLPVTSEGAVFAFTVEERTDVRLWVRLEGCCDTTKGEAMLTRLLPAKRPKLVYEPEVDEALVLGIGVAPAQSEPWTLEHPGVYAVSIPSIPIAMGEGAPIAHVRVIRAR